MAKVALLGSMAFSVGGVVPTSNGGCNVETVRVTASAQMMAEAKLKAPANTEAGKATRKPSKTQVNVIVPSKSRYSEGKAMKISINPKGKWWTASLLGVPVDGSSN
jgi:hypothetical protein